MSHARILVVEDELIVARDIVAQLHTLGYDPVGQTTRGDDAVTLACQLKPDLVLMDIQLEGPVDGIVAAAAIRQEHGLPVVFLTAFAGDQLVERAKTAEPFGYIVKPFAERELRIVIEMALERHRVETELRRSRDETAAVLRASMDSFWTVGLDGRIRSMNAAACALTGYTAEELQQMTIADLEFGRTPEQIAAGVEAVIRLGSVRIERQFQHKDGRIRLVEMSVTCSPGPDRRLFCFGRDITEQRRAAEALRESEQRSRTLVEHVGEGIATVDLDERFTFANPAAEAIFGVASGTLAGRTLAEFTTPEQFQLLRAQSDLRRSGAKGLYDYEIRRPDGETRSLLVTAVPQSDGLGQLTGTFGVFRDITARRKAAADLALRESYLSAVVANQPGLLWLKDSAGRLLIVNRAFASFCGRAHPKDMIGLTDFDLWPRQLAELYREWDLEVMRSQSTRSVEEMIPVGPERKWFETFKAPVLDADGHVLGITGYAHDITQRKLAELRWLQSKAELQQTNAQLYVSIAQARELAVEAEAANRAKSSFLTSMSHELRTPLNVINGMAATLVDQARTPDETQAAQLILEGGQTLLGIIEEILDYSGLQAGKPKLDPRPFDVLGMVAQVLRLAGEAARRQRIDLTYWIAPSVPARVVSDPRRIQQTLLNLLNNAVKFTERGRVHLSCTARPLGEGRLRLEFAVSDTGIGLAPHQLTQLFQPFARLAGSNGALASGSGLGLVISRSFAQLLGGEITVRSRPGRGSVFRCSIIVDETEKLTGAMADCAPAAVRGRRVLVVADQPRQRRLLTAVARAWEMPAVVASSATLDAGQLQSDGGPFAFAILDPEAVRNQQGALARWLQPGAAGSTVPVVWLPRLDPPPRPAATAPSAVLTGPLELSELARVLTHFVAPPAAGPATPAAAPAAKLGERLPLRILAADDIRTNREMLRRMFLHLGYTISLAENGAEAVAALRLQPFDLVLLDVQMPVMDGLTAAREICRLHPDRAQRPKLVALTANALPGDRESCLDAGMDEYLTKPVLPKELEACFLRLFVSGGRPGTAAAQPAETADLPWVDRVHLEHVMPGLSPAQAAETIGHLHDAAATDFHQLWPRIVDACARKDCLHLAELVHGLKGCFLMLGWTRIASFCVEVLTQARKGEFTAWETFPSDLKQFYNSSTAAMTDYLSSTVEPPAPDKSLVETQTDR